MLHYEICHYVLVVSFTVETETCWCNMLGIIWIQCRLSPSYFKKKRLQIFRSGFKQIYERECEQGVVCHTVALPIYLKKYLTAEEELWKLKYFTMQ
jgi:hypothetical protein